MGVTQRAGTAKSSFRGLGWAGLLLLMPLSAGAAPHTFRGERLETWVRDSHTGRSLSATLVVESMGEGGLRQTLEGLGRLPVWLPAGTYRVEARAPGFAPLESWVSLGQGPSLPMTLWLDPLPDLGGREEVHGLTGPLQTLIEGHVVDATSGEPVGGASVRLDWLGVEGVTDEGGAFRLLAPAEPLLDLELFSEADDLVVEAPGYQAYWLAEVALTEWGDSHFVVDLPRGEGLFMQEEGHKLWQEGGASALEAADLPSGSSRGGSADWMSTQGARTAGVAMAAATVPVPASIRVGYTSSGGLCCTGSCGSVSVFSLETYVKRGLDDEWISSWSAESLKAGAVAYRSYGAYHVYHPAASSYDICSSSCCQVNDSSTTTATDSATAATAGVELTKDQVSVYRSEYSAENNDYSTCSNGYAGSPDANWPCLSDSVCSGSSPNGHGRGMCQWGSSRWASQGKDWSWILNHYYNNNGQPSGERSAYIANASSGGTSTVLDSFESSEGHFATAPTYSGSTVGIATSSTAERLAGTVKAGSYAEQLKLLDNTSSSANWEVRFLSGVGDPAQNVKLTRAGGRIGFWVYTGASGLSASIGLDDSDGTERAVKKAVPQNTWTYLEWKLDDAAQWDAWSNGNGQLDLSTPTLDAIWFFRAQTSYTVYVYVDDVTFKK